MESQAIKDYFICNGNINPTNNMDIFDIISEKAVYEVIKIIDGIPLYFNEHLNRMKKSLRVLGAELKKSDDEILKEILELVELNKCSFINVKLVYDFIAEDRMNFLIFFIKSEYPQDEIYKNGIHTTLFKGERETPNIKTLSGSFRERVQKAREEKDAYEALLVNEFGYITEGSRSNIFFIKDNRIFTPPGGKVLLGVTRNYVLKICSKLSIKVKEELIDINELKDIQGAFITGTTVDILPIYSIDNIKLSTSNNNIMQSIIDFYNIEMKKNIKELRGYLTIKNMIN